MTNPKGIWPVKKSVHLSSGTSEKRKQMATGKLRFIWKMAKK